jgi:hypothetical protein
MNLILKTSDVNYSFTYPVTEDDGTIVNLTNATTKFKMGNTSKIIFTNPSTVIDAVNGLVSYSFTEQDTMYDGAFIGEFEITFADGRILSYPRSGYISVFIQRSVDSNLPNITLEDIAVKQGDYDNKLNQIIANSTSLSEVIDARGTFNTVGLRLADTDVSLLEKINQTTIESMRDPLAYINSVEVLTSFSARGQSTTAWIQGFSINEITNEIYIAIQENNGTYLTIEIRDLNGIFKQSKTLTITSGSFTEGLPFFYNVSNQLCFVVRTQTTNTYAIYNYTLGTLGSPVAISGTPYKSALDGNYFVTCDVTSSVPYTINTIYVYDWVSVQNGTPTLLNSFRTQNMGGLIEKAQGLVVNNGYIFLTQGESNGNPAITIYNTAGQLVNVYLYTKESLASAINTYSTGVITDLSGYTYENEGGCKYKGKLVTAHILNNVVYITIHNSQIGTALETKVPIYKVDTGYIDVNTYLNGAIIFAADTQPQIRRIGNIVEFSGGIKGIASTVNVEVLDFGTVYAPRRNITFTSQTSNGYQCGWQIQPNGRARITTTKNPSPDTTSWYPFSFTWTI